MARVLMALLLSMMVAACATTGVQTEGVSGPVAWRATELRIEDTGQDAGLQQNRQVYHFTLVLQETQGIGITFTKVAYTMSSSDIHPASSEATGRWELQPKGVLQWLFMSSYGCPGADCEDPIFYAPIWNFDLTGTDERGQPVRLTFDVRLPIDPGAKP